MYIGCLLWPTASTWRHEAAQRGGHRGGGESKAIAKQRQHKKLQRSQANHANQQQADARAGRIARWVIANPGKTAADCPFARRGAPPL